MNKNAGCVRAHAARVDGREAEGKKEWLGCENLIMCAGRQEAAKRYEHKGCACEPRAPPAGLDWMCAAECGDVRMRMVGRAGRIERAADVAERRRSVH